MKRCSSCNMFVNERVERELIQRPLLTAYVREKKMAENFIFMPKLQ